MPRAKGLVRRLGPGLLALALACGSGCAALVVGGVAAGAGAAGYFYLNGLMYREYKAGLADTTQAVRAGLAELHFPIAKQKTDTGTAYLETKTSDGYKVQVYLNVVPSPIPAEGAVTRVSVRVGFAGDDKVSASILDATTKALPGSGLPPLVPVALPLPARGEAARDHRPSPGQMMPPATLGLDIGGANLKAATPAGQARALPFALWKQPERLQAMLARLAEGLPAAGRIAATMTGELCDCFATRQDGVRRILEAVAGAFPGVPVRVWDNQGRFSSIEDADWRAVASANWLASATLLGRKAPLGRALLADIGTTTADFVPLLDGKPVPVGRTDAERLAAGELVYRGWRRTPLCVLYPEGAAELFATTLDVCLALGLVPERPDDRDTADGQPASRAAALRRLARLRCADADEQECLALARLLHGRLLDGLRAGSKPVETVLLAGSGAFLAEGLFGAARVERVEGALGECACAHAVAVLADEEG